MRADNRGEGGLTGPLALISRACLAANGPAAFVMLGVLATCLFFGDAMITPAISVLSAVEWPDHRPASLEPLVILISIGILVGLFLVQARGRRRSAPFGPVVLIYSRCRRYFGVYNIMAHLDILGLLSLSWAVEFFLQPEARIFGDGLGVPRRHWRRDALCRHGPFRPQGDRLSRLGLVYPRLDAQLFGTGALLLGNPAAVDNPFYLMAPEWARLPLVGIATLATIIASRAVISGAF